MQRLTISVLLLLGLALLASGCGETGGTQASSTATTSAPVRTPTPSKPTILQSAVILGGSVVAFDKKFGADHCCYRNGWNHDGPYGPMWTGVQTDHNFATNVDESSTDRVTAIENGGTDDTDWMLTVDQWKMLCGAFLPSDASFHTSTTLYLDPTLAGGILLTYSSTLLANTLPANDFTDKTGKATPPGTFFIYYNYTYNGSSNPLADGCELATDEALMAQVPS